jgi:endonuclease/exonuclease/phosphatase family metal-dependent hydrolase
MTFNVGTTLSLRHDDKPNDGYTAEEAKISDHWYGNGLSWPEAIRAVSDMIKEVNPDIVAFQEIFDCRECEQIPIARQKGFVCENWSPGDPNVANIVLGKEYQVAYHPNKRSKCLAVHKRFGVIRGCKESDCEDALEGYPVQECGSGSRVARAFIDRPNGQTLTVISLHGTSGRAPKDQRCRVRQVEQIFVDFGDGKPGVRGAHNLILGDFNTDPGRGAAIDVSALRWNDFVGKSKSFRFISKVGNDAPRAFRGFADIDHIVADSFQGTCRYIGLDDQSPPVWKGIYFDHVPVICKLSKIAKTD